MNSVREQHIFNFSLTSISANVYITALPSVVSYESENGLRCIEISYFRFRKILLNIISRDPKRTFRQDPYKLPRTVQLESIKLKVITYIKKIVKQGKVTIKKFAKKSAYEHRLIANVFPVGAQTTVAEPGAITGMSHISSKKGMWLRFVRLFIITGSGLCLTRE